MVIKTNKKLTDGVGASSVYHIWKAIKDLGHTALCREETADHIDLVLDVDGVPPTARIEGVPYFYWDCDSFMHDYTEGYDKTFIGGAPEDLERYPEGTVFLPHAFDPELHRPLNVGAEYDIVMAGSMSSIYEERKRLTQLLRDNFSVLEIEPGYGEGYNVALNKGRLIFNRSLSDTNIPMRFFEGMAVGALLHNDTGNLDAFATPFDHFIPYTTDENLITNARYYLEHDDLRNELASQARTNALNKHTYKHRVQTILSYL